MTTIQVGIVIPVFNEQDRIISAIRSIVEKNEIPVKFYIADDLSTDDTVCRAAEYLEENSIAHQILVAKSNKGAGYRRNQALKFVEEPYVLFFDADDFVYPGMLDKAVEKANDKECDVLLMEYDLVQGRNDQKLGMIEGDRKIFDRIAQNVSDCLSIDDNGYLLNLVNYPWNKLVSTRYAKEIGLRFSNTPVHNDVMGHWMLLMNSKNISFLSESFCGHRVCPKANQVTNISDSRRLAMLDVFQELERYFSCHPELKRKFYHFFMYFKLKLYSWASNRLDEEYRNMFKVEFSKTFSRMNRLDILNIAERMPETASEIMRFKLGLK
ncbi:glycosyltransferase family A protein [Microbulbifer sp. TRSA005]|uniref:glycosyltransferase family A protein n=1 Tax=unclassified Microbulbifer TaxID=2619833 RepID=UPI00403A6841